MNSILLFSGLILVAIAVNIPLGYVRQGTEKFTFAWYFYIHISIPLIIYLRVKAGFSWKLIPLTLAGTIAGQIIGGRIRRRREQRG
jgi:hypothetical protein